jgi:hypothetical protein
VFACMFDVLGDANVFLYSPILIGVFGTCVGITVQYCIAQEYLIFDCGFTIL